MKKLPLCALISSAGFAVAIAILLLELAPRPSPFVLFLPLLWDAVMVGVSAAITLRCGCARRIGFTWAAFCVLATLGIGAAAFDWLLPQTSEPLSSARVVFMVVTVGFGVVFSVWQFFALNSRAVRDWTDSESGSAHPSPLHHG